MFDGRRDQERIDQFTESRRATLENLEAKRRARERIDTLLEQDRFDADELHRRLFQNRDEILALERKLAELEAEIAAIEGEQAGDKALQAFLTDQSGVVEQLQEKIIALPPEAKKELFNTLLEGDIEIGVDEEIDEKWQIMRIPFVFKPEAFERYLVTGARRAFNGSPGIGASDF